MDLKDVSNDELIQWYRNARYTAMSCGVNVKAAMNYDRSSKYLTELKSRGLDEPRDDRTGVFNGPGAV